MELIRSGTQRRYILPDLATGYQLDPAQGFFSAVLPLGVDKTNIDTNPSIEIDTTGCTAVGSALARVTDVQKWGLASLKVTPTAATGDGMYKTYSLTSGLSWYGSVYFKGTANLKYKLYFATTGAAALGQVTSFNATGAWQRVSCVYRETASTTRRLYVVKDGQTNVRPFWVDGFQIEQDQLTTYIDGDQKGYVRNRLDYYWTGTPQASASVRIGQSRAGGAVVPFDKLGFRLLSIVGLGMGGILNQFTPMARGGAFYAGTVFSDRQFTLVGQIDDDGLYGLAQKRQAFIDLFKPDVVTPDQPVTLKYTPTDDCGNVIGSTQDILCVYESDLGGRTDNLNSERLALTFRLYLPYTSRDEGDVGAVLSYQTTLASNYLLARNSSAWVASSIFNGAVYAIAYDRLYNRTYFGGAFTTVGGVTMNHITYLDDTGFHPLASTPVGVTGGVVWSISIDANGGVLIGGSYNNINGSGAKGLAIWFPGGSPPFNFNPTTASFVAVYATAIDKNGNYYFGGDFTDWNGNAGGDYISYIPAVYASPSSGNPLGTGMNGIVSSLAIGTDGTRLYAAGVFTTGNGVTLNGIGYWNGVTFVSMGSGPTGGTPVVNGVAVNPFDGNLLAVGNFTAMNGVAALNAAVWNQSVWKQLGTGLPAGSTLDNVAVGPNGTIYAVGNGPVATNNPGYVLASGTWRLMDISIAGSPAAYSVLVKPDGTLYVGMSVTGTATAPATTTITNTGSASAGPIVTFTGPATLEQLTNLTTGKTIYFNLSLQTGEVAVLDLSDPSGITFISTTRGNVLSGIAPGSQAGEFVLAPGVNVISLFEDGSLIFTPTGATAASLIYRNTNHSLDSAIPNRLLP